MTQIVEQKVEVVQTVEVEKKIVETQVVEKIVEATARAGSPAVRHLDAV